MMKEGMAEGAFEHGMPLFPFLVILLYKLAILWKREGEGILSRRRRRRRMGSWFREGGLSMMVVVIIMTERLASSQFHPHLLPLCSPLSFSSLP